MEVLRKNVVLQLYRQLICHSRLISNKSESALKLNEIKTTFRNNKNINDINEIDKLIEIGQKKLGFLKISTPRPYYKSSKSAGVYRLEDGKWVEGGSSTLKGKRQYKDQGIDIMDWNRHVHLLKRQHFMNRR
eukprot:gene8633-10625_t